MKYYTNYLFILSILIILIFLSCNAEKSIQMLHVSTFSSNKRPIVFQTSNLFQFDNRLQFFDTSKADFNFGFLPYLSLTINRDTTIRFFSSDTIKIYNMDNRTEVISSNLENINLNLFFKEISKKIDSINNYYKTFEELLKEKENIIEDENYIANYLSKTDNQIKKEIDSLTNKFRFSKDVSTQLLNSVLNTRKLSRNYSLFQELNVLEKIDSLGKLYERQNYYISQLNKQQVSDYALNTIAYLTDRLAYWCINLPIGQLKNENEVLTFYNLIQKYFPKKSISYDYTTTYLWSYYSKRKKFNLEGNEFKHLKRDAKKSQFKMYSKEIAHLSSVPEIDRIDDLSVYDTKYMSFALDSIINSYKNKKLLINFWASWCLPCIKQIPATINYMDKYPNLNVLFISVEKNQDIWKYFIYNHDMLNYKNYRKNFMSEDTLLNGIKIIPQYGLLVNDRIKLFENISDSTIQNYLYE